MAVRRRAVTRPQQPDCAALGQRVERRVADPVEDEDVERGADRGLARRRSPGRHQRERDCSENCEQGKNADRPDHQLSILTEERNETKGSPSGVGGAVLEQLLEARGSLEGGEARRLLEPLLAPPPHPPPATSGRDRRRCADQAAQEEVPRSSSPPARVHGTIVP